MSEKVTWLVKKIASHIWFCFRLLTALLIQLIGILIGMYLAYFLVFAMLVDISWLWKVFIIFFIVPFIVVPLFMLGIFIYDCIMSEYF